MDPSTEQARPRELSILIAYYGMIVIFFFASQYPEFRVWGVNWWAYFPVYLRVAVFGLGSAAPLFLYAPFAPKWIVPSAEQSDHRSRHVPILILTIAAAGVLFYLFRTRTHFLGDGYTLLSLLSEAQPLMKQRELGEGLAHHWVKLLVGGGGAAAAIASYRIISIGAGVVFLCLAAWASVRLFVLARDRLLFFLALAAGGYAVLFFGYVENYSLFVVTATATVLVGLLFTTGRVTGWLVLFPLILSIWFHVLGVALIPGITYLLMAGSRPGRGLRSSRSAVKLLLLLTAVVAAVVVFAYARSTSLFFRLAVLPLVHDRFTVDDYTLLSVNHLLDFLNLLLLLLPGLPVLLAAIVSLPRRERPSGRSYRFLLVNVIAVAGAVFVLDPKLGMARDWDLFAVAGVPLAVFFHYLILKGAGRRGELRRALVLSIVLSIVVLAGRVASLNSPDVAVAHFEHHLNQDPVRGRTSWTLLLDHYRKAGDSATVAEITRKRDAIFPERKVFNEAFELLLSGKSRDAVPLFHWVIATNPIHGVAWSNLGECYLNLQQYAKAIAYLDTALGLNPHNAAAFNNRGLAYAGLHRYEHARRNISHAIELDPVAVLPVVNLARLYSLQGDQKAYIETLERAVVMDRAPPDLWLMLVDAQAQRGKFLQASAALQQAIERGVDTSAIREMREKYPVLQQSRGAPSQID